MRTGNTWRGVKVCLVQEHPKIFFKAIYGNGCGVSTGDDPFGNIIKHIADLYEVRKHYFLRTF